MSVKVFYFERDVVSILVLLNICILWEISIANFLNLDLCMSDQNIQAYMFTCVYVYVKNMCTHAFKS